MHTTVVPRLIRISSLPIDLDGLKILNKIILTGVVYSVFWKKACGLLRIDVETIQNRVRKLPTRAHFVRTDARPTRNQKEKLNGRVICTTVVSRTVREIPFGIDKTDGSHAQRTRKSK